MFGFIPHNEAKQTVFFGTDTATWQTWTKPSGISQVAFTIIGGGGSGYGTTGGIGGGGGGSGGITQIMLPSIFLPNTIFMRVGGIAIASYVSIYPSTTAAYVLGYANGGTNAASSAGGSGAIVATIANMPLAAGFYYILQSGTNGAAGGNNTAGGSITLGGFCLSGGAGGGGGSASGGNITGAGIIPTINGGIGNGTVGGTLNAGSGVWFWKGFKGCGGAGGGARSTAPITGGNGGDGAYGCGGGGGGSTTTSAGIPGKGGQGLVVVHYW